VDEPPDHSSDDLGAVVWNLEPIVENRGEDGARGLLDQARRRADAFVTQFAGRVAELEADSLVEAVNELTEIRELLWRVRGYARMRCHADSSDTVGIALRAAAEAAQAEVDAKILFFELEWVALDQERADALLADAGTRLDFAAHHLRRLRWRRPYVLDDDQERLLAETSVQRLMAWKRLFSEHANRLTAEIDGEVVPMTQAMNLLGSPVREQRLKAMEAIAVGATAGLPARVAAYNQVLGEKAVDDRLRGYPTWLSSRNLMNEATDVEVETLIAAVGSRHDLPQRWNRLKARLLDIERLASSDVQAPLPSVTRSVTFSQSRQLIAATWSAFSPRAGAIVDGFFTEGLIDAPIRENKQGGALCSQAGASSPPYVLLNYDSRPQDTMALAHELGHALHFELARPQRALQCESSIPLAEVASTFSEALVAEHLLASAADDGERLGLLAARIDDAMSNVFLGCAFLSAEAAMHRHVREHGEMSGDELSEIWTDALRTVWGDTVDIDEGFRLLWSLIPHMIWEPGYLYSYAYGLLTAWSAFARYKQLGDPFAGDYLAMLAAGGSRSPQDLVAMIGLDVTDQGFWSSGLKMLDEMLDRAEALAR
jgi:oligoendopeptidase F